MDPMDLEQLLHELSDSSSSSSAVPVPAESLSPGLVLAGGMYDRHVVVRPPLPLNTMATLILRSLYGGHTLTVRRPRTADIRVYRQRLHVAAIARVPDIPRAHIPSDPTVGDRIAYMGRHRPHLGVSSKWIYHHDGLGWSRDDKQAHPRNTVVDTDCFTCAGSFVYIPVRHRLAHLYLDGLPTPARTVGQLSEGDVLLETGGGRHVVHSITREGPHSTRVGIEVLELTRTPLLTQVPAARAAGDRLEFVASPRALYSVEPRATEYVRAADIRSGDVILARFGHRRSAVATVADTERVPVRQRDTVHLQVTGANGQPRTHCTGTDSRYVLLHRPAQASAA